jgi:hypothetical protein
MFHAEGTAPLSTPETQQALEALAEEFGDDRDVMLETENEPFMNGGVARPTAWLLWRDGGPDPRPGSTLTFVGVNGLIAAARARGAKNVIILQGLSGRFTGFPGGVVDPLNQLLYSVHPFFRTGRWPRDMDWDANFGDFAQTHPLAITAWNVNLTLPDWAWCETWPLDTPLRFMDYLKAHAIGLIGWSFSVPGSMVRSLGGPPTTLDGHACGDTNAGGGAVVQQYFRDTMPPLAPVAPALSWQGDGQVYDVYLGTDATPDATEHVGTVQTISFPLPLLRPQTRYYWRIDAWKLGAGTANGPVWTFRTGAG